MRRKIVLSIENKKLIKYLGIIFLSVLLTYKLPHDSYSIIQYLIPPIRTSSGVIFLSWIIPLILFIIGLNCISKMERFVNSDRVILFITIVIIVIPLMRGILDFTRTGYHWVKDDGLRAVDIKRSDINLFRVNDEMIMQVDIELKAYSRKDNRFNIRVYLPESLREITGEEFFELKNDYYTGGGRILFNIQEDILVQSDIYFDETNRQAPKWYREDVEYELYNNDETVRIIHHGL